MGQFTSPLMDFDVTRRLLIEQTMEKIYQATDAKITFAWQRLSNQLMPPYLERLLTSLNRLQIVEVNCGYGLLSNYISMLCPHTQILGIDADLHKIEVAKTSIGNRCNINFSAGDFNQVPKVDADLLILHVDESDPALSLLLERASHWLAPGGDILICVANRKTKWLSTLLKTLETLNVKELVGQLADWFKRPEFPNMTSWSTWRAESRIEQYERMERYSSQWQNRLSAKGYACLAEYDPTQQTHTSLLTKLGSYVSGKFYFHAEKPIFTPSAKAKEKNYGSLQVSKNSIFCQKEVQIRPVTTTVDSDAPIVNTPNNFTNKDNDKGFFKRSGHLSTHVLNTQNRANQILSDGLSTPKQLGGDDTFLPNNKLPQTAIQASPLFSVMGNEGVGMLNETDEALGYIFSKPWKCFSQEVQTRQV